MAYFVISKPHKDTMKNKATRNYYKCNRINSQVPSKIVSWYVSSESYEKESRKVILLQIATSMSGDTFEWRSERFLWWKLEMANETNWREHHGMKRYSLCEHQKTQYCQNMHTAQNKIDFTKSWVKSQLYLSQNL